MGNTTEAVSRVLKTGESFLIAAHSNPDGDAIGASTALGYILKKLGKPFILYNYSGLPRQFDWLPLPGPFTDKIPENRPEWTFVLDCGAEHRLGPDLQNKLDPEKTVNIDHHLGNPMFGKHNWVDTTRPSVGEMIADLARALDIPLEGGLGKAVYLAMVSDTGFFTYGNTQPATLRTAADIIEAGLNIGEINGLIRNQWTLNRLRLWSEAMGRVEMYYSGRVGVMTVPKSLLEKTGTTIADCDNLASYPRMIRGVRASAILREDEENFIKFSLRSQGEDNVQAVAEKFGGGGHRNASGGSIEAPLDQARDLLVKALGEHFGFETN